MQSHLKGKNNLLLNDNHRSTNDNIKLRRIQLAVENAILTHINYCDQGRSKRCFNQYKMNEQVELPKKHDMIDRYGDYGGYGDTESLETTPSLNFSDCSRETRANGQAYYGKEILELLGFKQILDEKKDTDHQRSESQSARNAGTGHIRDQNPR